MLIGLQKVKTIHDQVDRVDMVRPSQWLVNDRFYPGNDMTGVDHVLPKTIHLSGQGLPGKEFQGMVMGVSLNCFTPVFFAQDYP